MITNSIAKYENYRLNIHRNRLAQKITVVRLKSAKKETEVAIFMN